MKIQAIETRAYGCRFRSRLEARWAVFFTAMEWAWEYEPEGFELPSGRYLPDFRVEGLIYRYERPTPCWVEIKPGSPPEVPTVTLDAEGRRTNDPDVGLFDLRWVELARESEEMVFILRDLWRPGKPPFQAQAIEFRRCIDPACSKCRAFSWGHPVLTRDPEYWIPTEGQPHSPRVVRAFEKATSARFEHGETP